MLCFSCRYDQNFDPSFHQAIRKCPALTNTVAKSSPCELGIATVLDELAGEMAVKGNHVVARATAGLLTTAAIGSLEELLDKENIICHTIKNLAEMDECPKIPVPDVSI